MSSHDKLGGECLSVAQGVDLEKVQDLVKISLIVEHGKTYSRFPYEVTPAMVEQQENRGSKIINELGPLSSFPNLDEEGFEKWIDEAAGKATTKMLCPSLFKNYLIAYAPPKIAGILRQLVDPNSITNEAIVDFIAKQLFARSNYVEELEAQIFNARKRYDNVWTATVELGGLAYRYLNLCHRFNRSPTFGNETYLSIIFRCLPEAVELRMRENVYDGKSLSEILAKARDFEYAIPKSYVSAFPVDKTRVKCHGCGAMGHYRKDCPNRDDRCLNCNLIGHTSAACRNLVKRNNQKNLVSVTTPSRSSVTTKVQIPGTSVEKANTAKELLQSLLEAAKVKQRAAAVKRDEERRKAGKEVVMKKVRHAMFAEEEPTIIEILNLLMAEEIDSADDEVEDSCSNESTIMCVSAPCTNYYAVNPIVIPVCVGGVDMDAQMDTLAHISLVNESMVEKIGAKRTGNVITLKGVGSAPSVLTTEVNVVFNGRGVSTRLAIMKDLAYDLIIGLP